MPTEKSTIYISYKDLPDAENWKIRQTYRVKLVLRQVGMKSDGAEFEILDASSLEREDKGKGFFLSEGGSYKR